MGSVSNKLIALISLVGLIFSVILVKNELLIGNYCPKVLILPACYIVLVAFFLVLLSCLIKTRLISILLFEIGADVGLILAIWFSFAQFKGLKQCPVSFGIPLCYASLATFILLSILQFFRVR